MALFTKQPQKSEPNPFGEDYKMAKDDGRRPAAAMGEVNALLGRGSEFEGKLTFEGTVRIDGIFSGQIFTEDVLIVGEGAVIRAEIEVGTIVINGEVLGNVRAKNAVEIHAPGRLKGNVITPNLQIDRGVIFEGTCQMENIDEKLRKGGAAAKGVVTPPGAPPAPVTPTLRTPRTPRTLPIPLRMAPLSVSPPVVRAASPRRRALRAPEAPWRSSG